MPTLQLKKNNTPIKVKTRTVQGCDLIVDSVSRYADEDGFEIVSFLKPYYRNGYNSWNGNIEKLCWVLMKDEKSLYSSMSPGGIPTGTKKSCVSALKYIKEFGKLPEQCSDTMRRIDCGEYWKNKKRCCLTQRY